jgi:hypothetical protein
VNLKIYEPEGSRRPPRREEGEMAHAGHHDAGHGQDAAARKAERDAIDISAIDLQI